MIAIFFVILVTIQIGNNSQKMQYPKLKAIFYTYSYGSTAIGMPLHAGLMLWNTF